MAGMTVAAVTQLAIGGKLFCFTEIKDNTEQQLTVAAEESICGSLDPDKGEVDEGIITPRLTIKMQPTPEELDLLLPQIGFTETTDTFALDDDLSGVDLDVVVNRIASVDTYSNGVVDKAIFRAMKGKRPLSIELECVFKDYDIDSAGSMSATAISGRTAPMPMHRSVLTLEAAARAYQSAVVVIDNHVVVQHNNSRKPTALEAGHRTVHLGVDTPYTSDEVDLLENVVDGYAGAAGSLVFTRGGLSTTFSFTNLKASPTPPSIGPKGSEVRLMTYYQSFANGATKPLVIVNDITA